uniref:MIP03152p n=1 Tax=Drosophila melanogaster TaxID=7227 RepID=D8FT07_DROME|nr:MIP03152p [Drosophila melanogaster]
MRTTMPSKDVADPFSGITRFTLVFIIHFTPSSGVFL